MIKRQITYTDFNGNEQKETLYFNLSKLELTKLQLSYPNGLDETIKTIIANNEQLKLLEIFKHIIVASYGVKSEDGKRFIKNEEIRNDFESSAVIDVLFEELIVDEKKAEQFFAELIKV